jgi:hypothetical protein
MPNRVPNVSKEIIKCVGADHNCLIAVLDHHVWTENNKLIVQILLKATLWNTCSVPLTRHPVCLLIPFWLQLWMPSKRCSRQRPTSTQTSTVTGQSSPPRNSHLPSLSKSKLTHSTILSATLTLVARFLQLGARGLVKLARSTHIATMILIKLATCMLWPLQTLTMLTSDSRIGQNQTLALEPIAVLCHEIGHWKF